MPSRTVLAFALLTGMTLAAAGCGSQAAGTSAGGPASSPAGLPSASPAATATCGPAVAVSSSAPLTLSSRDSGGTFCLRVGQSVLVYLNGSPTRMWAPIHSDSSVLRPAPNGHLMLMRGVTGAAFTATRPGTAHITSARPVCTQKPVSCDAMIAFHVTLVIAKAA